MQPCMLVAMLVCGNAMAQGPQSIESKPVPQPVPIQTRGKTLLYGLSPQAAPSPIDRLRGGGAWPRPWVPKHPERFALAGVLCYAFGYRTGYRYIRRRPVKGLNFDNIPVFFIVHVTSYLSSHLLFLSITSLAPRMFTYNRPDTSSMSRAAALVAHTSASLRPSLLRVCVLLGLFGFELVTMPSRGI